MSRFWKVAAAVVLVVLACISPEGVSRQPGGLAFRIRFAGGGGAPLDSAYVVLSGPTSSTQKVTPGTTVTISNLQPGSYTVALEGFQNGGVTYFGQVTGVSVVAGQTTPANLTAFPVFQPTITSMPKYTASGQAFAVVYTRVASATGYVVQRDTLATFATSHDSIVASGTDTSVQLTIPPTGPYYVRVISTDPYGRRSPPSAPDTITTLTVVAVTPGGGTISAAGGTQTFTATAQDPKANPIPSATFTWASTNPNVATVAATGVATAVATGQSTIIATATGTTLSANGLVTVATPPTTAVNVWSAMSNPSGSNFIWTVWGTSPTNVFAVGGGGTTMHFDGTTWTGMTNPVGTTEVRGVWGPDSSLVFAVGGNGAILKQNGSAWVAMTSNTTSTLYGVWGSAADNVFAVGAGATVAHYDGTAWSAMALTVTTQQLWSVWGASATSVFAVGNANTIVFYNGSAWSAMSSPAPAATVLYRVWGLAANNVFAVGSGGVILHYDGTSWTQMTSGTTQLLAGVWGTSATEVYATGIGGTIQRFDGSAWSAMTSGQPGGDVWSTWGTSATNLVSVGFPGLALRGVRGAPVASFGYPTQFTARGSGFGANFLLGEAISVTSKIELKSLSIIDSLPAGNIKIALYTDAGGHPGTLVAQSSGPVSSAGALTYPAPQTQVAAGTYWIMATYDVGPTNWVDAATANGIIYVSDTFANALPATYPASYTGYTGVHFNYYVTGYVVP